MIGSQGRDVAAGGGKPIDHDHERFLLAQPRQRIVQLLGARGGAARAVDVNDHGRGTRLAQPLQRLHPILVGADEPGDGDARDRAAGLSRQHGGAGHPKRGAQRDDGADRDQDREHAPEGELSPHPATIDDGIGIERHRFISSECPGRSAPSLPSPACGGGIGRGRMQTRDRCELGLCNGPGAAEQR